MDVRRFSTGQMSLRKIAAQLRATAGGVYGEAFFFASVSFDAYQKK
jgi:hypothetical protein